MIRKRNWGLEDLLDVAASFLGEENEELAFFGKPGESLDPQARLEARIRQCVKELTQANLLKNEEERMNFLNEVIYPAQAVGYKRGLQTGAAIVLQLLGYERKENLL